MRKTTEKDKNTNIKPAKSYGSTDNWMENSNGKSKLSIIPCN